MLMSRWPLHQKIIAGMAAGIAFGLFATLMRWQSFTINYIVPWGIIFINLLKLMAIPLIITSIIHGVTGLSHTSQLSRLGTKTIFIYIVTTVIAITIGLITVNLIQPGKTFSAEKRELLKNQFAQNQMQKKENLLHESGRRPMQFLIDIVPQNIVQALSDNTRMLQVIFFALLFGIALMYIEPQTAQPIKDFFSSANAVILKMIHLIMIIAPYGTFALMAGLITEFSGNNAREAIELLKALGMYTITVMIGLGVMLFIFYPVLIKIYTGISYARYFRAMAPAQLVAFSTSSSAATLPITLKQVKKELEVPQEVAGLVLPLGATINMDGTSLYQAVATVFIAQSFGIGLDLSDQITIVFTATLASIGSAAVPGAGMVMLIIVLESVGIDPTGMALIMGVDRLIDMCRTVVNVSGDATCALLVARSEKLSDK